MKILNAPYAPRGGIHPAYQKDATRDLAIRTMPLPRVLKVSLLQHLGAPAKPAVQKGDRVLRGQLIGTAAGFVSAAVHAPTSGVVKSVEDAVTASGLVAPAVEIETDGQDEWAPGIGPRAGWETLAGKECVEIVAGAGISGMGGAGFPTHVKLSPPAEKRIDTVILNGAECEPFLTADHRLMVERAAEVWAGATLIRRILGAKSLRIAIEDNKPEAIAALEKFGAQDADASIVVLRTAYPQGAEKQQIYAVTGREVPSGGLPMDVGVIVENVGTAYAIWDAIANGRPLMERITTVTGSPIRTPSNVQARLGTSYADLIEFCGGWTGPAAKIISGGPMMGLAQFSLDVTTTKTTSGLLALSQKTVSAYQTMPCISCGRCVEACPSGLLPSELSYMLEAEDYETAEAGNVMDCIECGCCGYECPAHRPLVQHLRQGKARVAAKRREQQQKKP